MTPLEPIRAHMQFPHCCGYTLAEELDEFETSQVQTNHSRLSFFATHWPDLYTWLMLNISEENWFLYDKGEYPNTSFILAIHAYENHSFYKAFSERIAW